MAQENESSSEAQKEIELIRPSKPKKKKKEKSLDPNMWMVTFSDLITLMMTFFVLLFSFNEPNPKHLEAISSNAPGLFNLSESAVTQPISVLRANSLVRENLEIFLSENSVRNVEIVQTDEGLILTLPADIIFEQNSDRIGQQAIQTIGKIASFLNKTGHDIRIEGHTDNNFTPSPQFPDVWEMSQSRAYNVLQAMLKTGVAPDRLSLVGKGASQPKVSNATPQGQRVNRRVEIVILNR